MTLISASDTFNFRHAHNGKLYRTLTVQKCFEDVFSSTLKVEII